MNAALETAKWAAALAAALGLFAVVGMVTGA